MSSRRDFFRTLAGRKKPKEDSVETVAVVRPPYALSESLFLSVCVECESKACKTHCEEEIIVIKSDGTPTLNLTKKGCTFCEECADVCEAGVLDKTKGTESINAIFTIDTNSCLAHHSTICFACKEPCIDDAIIFTGMFNPVIDMSRCTACGFCMGRCPTLAISYEAVEIPIKEESE